MQKFGQNFPFSLNLSGIDFPAEKWASHLELVDYFPAHPVATNEIQ